MARKTIVKPKVKNTPKAEAATLSTKEIVALISAIKISAKDLQVKVHTTMAKIVVHAIKFGDVTLADRLINAFGERNKTVFRTNDLRRWFEDRGPFRYDTETKGFKLNKDKRDTLAKMVTTAKDTAAFYSKLMKVAPWEVKGEPEYKGFDFMKQIKAAIRMAQKAEKEHGNHPKTKLDGLDTIRRAVAALEEAEATGDNDNDDTITDVANVA